jgi:DNA-binding MarR family transcriptional regulator
MASSVSASPSEPGGGSPSPQWVDELALADVGLVARLLRLNLFVTHLLEEVTAAAGITPADYLVLGVLRLSPGHRSSPTRMCELLGRSTGGMTLTIDRLAAAGWLTRSQDPDDRRRVVIQLSPVGLKVSTGVNASLHAWEDGLKLEPGDRTAMLGMVDELLALFEQASGPVRPLRRRSDERR